MRSAAIYYNHEIPKVHGGLLSYPTWIRFLPNVSYSSDDTNTISAYRISLLIYWLHWTTIRNSSLYLYSPLYVPKARYIFSVVNSVCQVYCSFQSLRDYYAILPANIRLYNDSPLPYEISGYAISSPRLLKDSCSYLRESITHRVGFGSSAYRNNWWYSPPSLPNPLPPHSYTLPGLWVWGREKISRSSYNRNSGPYA